jgi:dynein heavy chain
VNDVVIEITDVVFYYQYEFLGAKERLCITALTERCYITLAQALGMMYGGAPAGPAGTGKTETVKDLGRTLGIGVVVTNCSDEQGFRDMAKIFKGVCQSGLWGCFDEFNRISLATLSVVAAQVESITIAKKQDAKRFMFPGEERPIPLIRTCAYFITMNPGYAGRQELPENLKVQFRSMSMMVPNFDTIMQVRLASSGYSSANVLSLALKFFVLYNLCKEQLSKMRHYDFGLRNILSVLRRAGIEKRNEPAGTNEELIIRRTLREMNMSKFVTEDIDLFNDLLEDIFVVKNPPQNISKTQVEITRNILKELNLQEETLWLTRINQLFDLQELRHGFMLLGTAGSGKTTIMNVVTKGLTQMGKVHKITKMNPKAILPSEMYGKMNQITGEWW